ncbi:hypothetical protein [uncultured Roseobacter sp.]|uniref:hypothetical protein n=1 Tax=uncultured Roseobacter sp. TaxID=114847 RepID=UPI0026202556|nr:hypothetical protein [uncultured Roseobacter sp.]
MTESTKTQTMSDLKAEVAAAMDAAARFAAHGATPEASATYRSEVLTRKVHNVLASYAVKNRCIEPQDIAELIVASSYVSWLGDGVVTGQNDQSVVSSTCV